MRLDQRGKARMRRCVIRALLLAVSVASTSANAQISQPIAQSACELHFWPASAVNTRPQPAQAQGGLIWAYALGGRKRAETLEAVRSDIVASLDAEGSLLALGKDNLATRLGLPPATLIVHDKSLDGSGLYRIKSRRAASTSPCYSELIVTGILYKTGSFSGGHALESSFMLREFGSAAEPARVMTGGGSIKLNAYPAKEGEDTEAASADLNSAFRQSFEKFVAEVSRPH